MTDVKLKQQYFPLEGVTMDFLLMDSGFLDQSEELATAVRVALGTDRLSSANEILPDPDSTDRRGWWADMDAETIWDGWPIGCKNWLLARAKITDAPSSEGSTLERAKRYTQDALRPFIEKRIASHMSVTAARTELDRIEVTATLYRGPLPEIELRYQLLWHEEPQKIVIPPPVPIIPFAKFVTRSTLLVTTRMKYSGWPVPFNIASSLSASAYTRGKIYAAESLAGSSSLSVNATKYHVLQYATSLLHGNASVTTDARIPFSRITMTMPLQSSVVADSTWITPPTMFQSIQTLGLTSGLKLCLDAGDIASYDPASQTAKWLDTSGNGYDFYRGSSTLGDAAQPTFNGTPGARLSSDYWSFDGGDSFLYDSANEAWMESLHQNNALFSFCGWVRFPSVSVEQVFFGTSHNDSTGVIFVYDTDTTNFVFNVYNASGTVYTSQLDVNLPTNTWFFLSLVVNEPAGTGFIGLNTTYGTTSANYSSPSSSNASYTLKIGSDGVDGGTFASGARMAMASFWSGIGLTQANMTAIRNATNRFGV